MYLREEPEPKESSYFEGLDWKPCNKGYGPGQLTLLPWPAARSKCSMSYSALALLSKDLQIRILARGLVNLLELQGNLTLFLALLSKGEYISVVEAWC